MAMISRSRQRSQSYNTCSKDLAWDSPNDPLSDPLLRLRIEQHRLVQVEGERRQLAGRTSASARMRAITSLPPSRVTTKVSEPGGLDHLDQAVGAVRSMAAAAVGAVGSVIASGRMPRITSRPP